MDIVVKGRHTEVPEHFRDHVAEKLSRVQRLDAKVIRLDVEISHERNPRQSSSCQRVEITCITKGPRVRAEAACDDFYAALDVALGKLEGRLRRSADRRRVHHGSATPRSVAAATAGLEPAPLESLVAQAPVALLDGERPAADPASGHAPAVDPADLGAAEQTADPDGLDGVADHRALDGGLVVREKTHTAAPMTLDQALHEMELVGHDFYLFADTESGLPSVVYRRRGYDYGVIHLSA